MALFIFDFDYTIVNGHTHNTIEVFLSKQKQFKHDNDRLWALIKPMSPIASADAWKDLFATLIAGGHQLAIASFSAYGSHIIPRFLRETLDLPESIIDKITIVSWLPKNPNKANKNRHIHQLHKAIGYQGDPASTVLIDDSRANVVAASAHGYKIIDATLNGDHLVKAAALSKQLSKVVVPNATCVDSPHSLFKVKDCDRVSQSVPSDAKLKPS